MLKIPLFRVPVSIFAVNKNQKTFSDKMSEQNQIKALVVDNGSCWSKAGFAGDNNPK